MPSLSVILLRSGFACLLFFQTLFAHSQVSGCKDPAANNYNPAATVNDGSCNYTPTSYTPPVKVNPMNALLNENSGLQWAGGSLWTFNDGLNAAAIYRIDTASNAILQTVNLDGASNVDWEDIAFDGTYFYIGDFGNNATGTRTDLKIYKFPLSAIAADYASNPVVTVPSAQIEIINFSYSNQTDFSKDTANYTKFDCEAMIADGGKLHLFTKNWIDVKTVHYVINGTAAGTYTATPVDTLDTGYLVTAADKAPGANQIVLLGYQVTGTASHFMHLLSDYSGGLYFNGNKRRIDLPDATVMGQAEGIALRTATYGYISNEFFTRTLGPFTLTVNQRLRWFNTAAFTPNYVLPLDLKSFTVQKQNGKHLINWNFAMPVTHLQLLHSSDGSNFDAVKNMAGSADGSFLFEPFSVTNCYRLRWQRAAGSDNYSNVICVDDKAKAGLTNLVLRKSGDLSFVINAAEADDYVFRLMGRDGRLLAQTTQRIVLPGYNAVHFAQATGISGLVLMQVIGKKIQYTCLVSVKE